MNKTYDLIVAGGGFTGVAAAVAAAREGMKVLVVEKNGFLGGAACENYVNPFMDFEMRDKETGKPVQLNTGIFTTILERLDELGGLHKNRRTFSEEYVKVVFDRLLREAGVDVLFHSYVMDAQVEDGRIKSISIVNISGRQEISARYFIDATGNAELSVLAGCDYQLGRETDNLCQPMTLCFRIANVDTDKYWGKSSRTMNDIYKKLQQEGKIKNPREDVLTFTHMADGVVHFNSTRVVKHNPTDVADVTEAEMIAREQMVELYHFMKENVAGFENATLLASAPSIGTRESRMVKGKYTIVADDIVNCTKFEDSIARGNYEIDIHSPDGTGTTHVGVPVGEYYTIPYRALVPQSVKNLLVAGRCISSTHEAQAAYRIIPICTCIGEGAGLAASLAANNGCDNDQINIDSLHALLDKYGASY